MKNIKHLIILYDIHLKKTIYFKEENLNNQLYINVKILFKNLDNPLSYFNWHKRYCK
jgi:hypothetical protein